MNGKPYKTRIDSFNACSIRKENTLLLYKSKIAVLFILERSSKLFLDDDPLNCISRLNASIIRKPVLYSFFENVFKESKMDTVSVMKRHRDMKN